MKKKIISLLTTLVVIVGMVGVVPAVGAGAESSGDYIYRTNSDMSQVELGDINGDGEITTVDVGLANAHARNTKLLNDEQSKIADINGDGKVTTADVGIINSHARGTNNQPSIPDEPPMQNGSYLFIGSYTSLTNTNIDGNVYVGCDGIAALENITINGDVYVYGQLNLTNCVVNGTLYGYNAYGGMFSCDAYDGIHGNIDLHGSSKIKSLYIMDDALDYAFENYGQR